MAVDDPDSVGRDPRAAWGMRSRRWERAKAWILGAVAVALIAWGGHWLFHRWTHVTIDDARIDGNVITIASRVSGWITELPVIEGDEVAAGQVLARVDDRDSTLQRDALLSKLKAIEGQMAVVRAQTGQVDQETLGRFQSESNRLIAAEAEAAALEVQLKQAQEDYRRSQEIEKFISRQELERAQTAYQQIQQNHRKARAEAEAVRGTVSSAGGSRRQLQVIQQQLLMLAHQAGEIRAEVRRQEIDIADRAILSPANGRVVMTFVRKGEHVAPGQRILMFHDPSEIWVEANVKETDIGRLKPGMKADVRVDAYPGKVFSGEVYRIGRAATNRFALLPDPNPSGNFTRITQRLPVRIVLAEKDPALRPGMMVEVDIAIRDD